MNAEKLIGFVCVAYGISDTLYVVTDCSFIHSIDQLLSRQHTRTAHPAPVSLFGFISHPCPPVHFTPPTFCLYWFRYLFPPEAFSAFPKFGLGALPPCTPSQPVSHSIIVACLLIYRLSRLTSQTKHHAGKNHLVYRPAPSAQGLTHNR